MGRSGFVWVIAVGSADTAIFALIILLVNVSKICTSCGGNSHIGDIISDAEESL